MIIFTTPKGNFIWMKKIKLIEKIEGEARLNISYDRNRVDFVEIEFFNTRNIENILKNKPALDALVINPRVCGICGHAHLQATVKTLESCIENITITKKAKILRELTLNFEIIQNHFKWFYLTVFPLLGFGQNVLKAIYPSQTILKAIAVIAGQYPHNSYSIVGGVVCEPTKLDIIKVKSLLDEVLTFFEKEVLVGEVKELNECKNSELLFQKSGDLSLVLEKIIQLEISHIGKSYDRFIVFGENSYFDRGKSIKTRVTKNIDERFVKETENINSYAKNVRYKDKYYEVGPLSRAMVKKTPLIKDLHRRFGDSLLSRIVARVCEIPKLIIHSKNLIEDLDFNEPSFIQPKADISNITAKGTASVEAARGSLIHSVQLKSGIIEDYQIITPTQWNLGNGDRQHPGIAQKAMIGLDDERIVELIFKSFDVCSVCTTH
jgi:hydrogenase large subunit